MRQVLDERGLTILFTQARTQNGWRDETIEDELLKAIYAFAKMGPTSANCSPARFVFIRSREGKEKLRPALSKGNIEKTMTAPATVIVAHGAQFFDMLPRLFRTQMPELGSRSPPLLPNRSCATDHSRRPTSFLPRGRLAWMQDRCLDSIVEWSIPRSWPGQPGRPTCSSIWGTATHQTFASGCLGLISSRLAVSRNAARCQSTHSCR